MSVPLTGASDVQARIEIARRFNEAALDFEATVAELSMLAPPKLSLNDVLDRLREPMLEQREEGTIAAQAPSGYRFTASHRCSDEVFRSTEVPRSVQ